MKKWLLATLIAGLLLPLFATEVTFPQYTSEVVDETGLLDASAKAQITKLIQNIPHFQVAVAVLSDTRGLPAEEYGYQLGRHWGVGDAQSDNGVLFLIVPSQREVRIDTGYGTETVLTDAKAGQILDEYVIPSFKEGKYQEGILRGTEALSLFLYDKQVDPRIKPVNRPSSSALTNTQKADDQSIITELTVLGFVILTLFSGKFKKISFLKLFIWVFIIQQIVLGIIWFFSSDFQNFIRPSLIVPIVLDLLLALVITLILKANGSSMGSRTHRSGSRFGGGGFRGGGGGSFGGGGAGRHW